jgi:hypothetical protein
MPSRTVLVPPGSLGALDAFRMVSRDMAKISGLQPLNIDALFAGQIVQAGIDRFLIYEKTKFGGKPSSLIASKTEVIAPRDLMTLYRRVSEVVDAQTVKKPDKKETLLMSLSGRIVDLVVAARYRTSLVLALPFEDISRYKPYLRPEFFSALDTFFGSLEIDASAVSLPRSVAKASDIKRLKKLLESDLFSEYSSAHQALELPQKRLHDQVSHVSSTARELTRGYSDYLTLDSLVISGLSITGYAIELFLGKLPATLLKPFKALFETYYSADHRVILYDFHSVWSNVFRDQIRLLMEAEKQGKIDISTLNDVDDTEV